VLHPLIAAWAPEKRFARRRGGGAPVRWPLSKATKTRPGSAGRVTVAGKMVWFESRIPTASSSARAASRQGVTRQKPRTARRTPRAPKIPAVRTAVRLQVSGNIEKMAEPDSSDTPRAPLRAPRGVRLSAAPDVRLVCVQSGHLKSRCPAANCDHQTSSCVGRVSQR
jgi:hypothetical protein